MQPEGHPKAPHKRRAHRVVCIPLETLGLLDYGPVNRSRVQDSANIDQECGLENLDNLDNAVNLFLLIVGLKPGVANKAFPRGESQNSILRLKQIKRSLGKIAESLEHKS
jgi:hypothetical protein